MKIKDNSYVELLLLINRLKNVKEKKEKTVLQ